MKLEIGEIYIKDIKLDKISKVENGVLYVKAAQTVKVEVYSLSGALMSQGTSDTAITLPRGMYLVKAGNQVQRVIL